ncbi:aegerolysin type hemolysin [Aspergillus pseudoustus]|uniref:Aegerolysin type hemolysin n=1 Tax=Aspergillus pseudoustus TaxID=1810923 RepID=A0ABR4IY58_9EURO
MSYNTTQRVSLSIGNTLSDGKILIQNLALHQGQPYKKGVRPCLISAEDVNKIVILPQEHVDVSFCGSAVHGIGVEGTLDIYHEGKAPIASIYWNAPYSRQGNELKVTNFDSEHYAVILGSFPFKGILGDAVVTIVGAQGDCASIV